MARDSIGDFFRGAAGARLITDPILEGFAARDKNALLLAQFEEDRRRAKLQEDLERRRLENQEISDRFKVLTEPGYSSTPMPFTDTVAIPGYGGFYSGNAALEAALRAKRLGAEQEYRFNNAPYLVPKGKVEAMDFAAPQEISPRPSQGFVQSPVPGLALDKEALLRDKAWEYGLAHPSNQVLVAMGPGGVTWADPKNPSNMTTIPLPEGSNPTSKITTAGGAVDPIALNGAVEIYKKTGTIPSFGFGNSSLRTAFFAAIGGDGTKIVDEAQVNKAVRAGMNKAYATQQNIYQANKTALGTLHKQLDLAKQFSAKVDRSGAPFLNKYILYAKGQIAGDADTAAFENLTTTASYEFAKILSGGAASIQGVTISSAEDAKRLLDASLNNGQFDKVVELMKQEADFRMRAQEETIAGLQRDLGQVGNEQPDNGGAANQDWKDLGNGIKIRPKAQ